MCGVWRGVHCIPLYTGQCILVHYKYILSVNKINWKSKKANRHFLVFVWSTCVFWLSRLSVVSLYSVLWVLPVIGTSRHRQPHILLCSCLTSPNTWQCRTFQGWIAPWLLLWRLHSIQLLRPCTFLFFFVRKKSLNLETWKLTFVLFSLQITTKSSINYDSNPRRQWWWRWRWHWRMLPWECFITDVTRLALRLFSISPPLKGWAGK